MIRAYLCLYNRHLFPCAQLPQYFPDFPAFLTEEHLAPIFRREYDVIFAVPLCMRQTSCFFFFPFFFFSVPLCFPEVYVFDAVLPALLTVLFVVFLLFTVFLAVLLFFVPLFSAVFF